MLIRTSFLSTLLSSTLFLTDIYIRDTAKDHNPDARLYKTRKNARKKKQAARGGKSERARLKMYNSACAALYFPIIQI